LLYKRQYNSDKCHFPCLFDGNDRFRCVRIKTEELEEEAGRDFLETPKGQKLSGKRTGLGQTLESNFICTKEAILIRENLSGKKTETGFFPVSF